MITPVPQTSFADKPRDLPKDSSSCLSDPGGSQYFGISSTHYIQLLLRALENTQIFKIFLIWAEKMAQ